MSQFMRRLGGPVAVVSLFALAGCVGAPAPGPVAYEPPGPVVTNPAYVTPGYSQGTGYYAPALPPSATPVAAYGARCYAGVYTCELPQQLPVGAQCSCPGLGAPSYGNVR